MQTTPHILMIRPVQFAFNKQTALSNTFQSNTQNDDSVQEKALQEFDVMSKTLQNKGVNVIIINDTPEPHTPDSIFPNNWLSFHADGSVFLYPMQAENRRLERRYDILQMIENEGFIISETNDLTHYENDDKFLEGTGSMILDRENKVVYACLSPRTEPVILEDFASQADFEIIAFDAFANEKAIYHTNVMMSLGEKYAVICLDAIPDKSQQTLVVNSLLKTGKEIIEISVEQMNRFAGNMLQVRTITEELLVVMSDQAYQSLTATQIETLSKHGELIHPDLTTIETNGGGSARCMMAEVFLPLV
ncbi:MAG: amidinotransferase [Verrucomicrobia bacterium]|nr:amidinotransferase [Cytophagales bacterium]